MAETSEETKRTPEQKLSALMGATDFSGGLSCPKCGCQHFIVCDKCDNAPGQIYRRRECRHCGHRISTVERIKA